MEKIAKRLTAYIYRNNIISEEEVESYQYGFLIGLEILIWIGTCLFIALCMKMVFECMLFIILFIFFRSFVGGIHLQKFISCYLLSSGVTSLGLALIRCYPFNKTVSIAIIWISLMQILYVQPNTNPNRYVTDEENIEFKNIVKKMIIAIMLASIVLFLMKQEIFLTTIAVSLSIVAISLVVGNIKNYVS